MAQSLVPHKPVTRSVTKGTDREHDGHFNQDAHNRGQGRP